MPQPPAAEDPTARHADTTSAAPSVRVTVLRFALSGLVVLVGIAVATAAVSQDLGQRQALDEARQIARLTGVGIVQPRLEQGLLDGDPAALDDLDAVVRDAVIAGSLVRVKLWSTDGRIVYSDERRLVGQQFTWADDRRHAIETGSVLAEVTDLSAPENRYERGGGDLLEVYVPLDGPDGPVLYEAYFQLDRVRQAGRQAWLAFAPVTIGALLTLQLVQIPLAWSLARRIRRDALHREELLRRALDASAVERRRIAGDLHDGVVQDLTGLSYALSAAARDDPDGVVAESARDLRSSVRQLRSLLVDIYPPDLATEGLGAALEDLLARHRGRGMAVTLDVDPAVELGPAKAALVHRIAQEALRNVATHAHAGNVVVSLDRDDGGVRLRVEDDGGGFDTAVLAGRVAGTDTDGHLGLRILRDTAAELGGRLVVRSQPGEGTEVELWVPAP